MARQDPQPLAVYTERLPQVKRVLSLYRDRVEISAAWTVGKKYQMTVSLTDLQPQPKRFFVRNSWFKRSILIGSLAVAVAVVFTREGYAQWIRTNALLGWGVASACALMAFLTFPARQFARFPRKDGRAGLDICRSGPDQAHFDEFIELIQKRITLA